MLDHLLRAEPMLRRRRMRMGVVIAAMVAVIAVADAQIWPGISLAFGYAIPIVLGGYVFGMRLGVELSVLCVILRRVCAGRTYGMWWLYEGSALMLAEYLMLAVGAGLLGRAVRRLEEHARALRGLSERARELTTALAPESILRQSVEAGVLLTGADGGFIATASPAGWSTEMVFARGRWRAQSLLWWPDTAGPWEASVRANGFRCDAALAQLGARVQVAVPVEAGEGKQRLALVVFRGAPRVFKPPTREVLELFALQLAAALKAGMLYTAAVQATEEKARVLACVAHDLRSPLHGLLWDLDTLRSQYRDGCRELERMNDNALIALELVKTLQEFAEIEGRRLPVQSERVPLGRVFEDLRAMTESLIAGRPVEFRTAIAAGAEWPVTDLAALHRILANLLSNAAKFTQRGTIELAAQANGTEIAISVRDTGLGIEPAELAHIFEPFYRGATRPASEMHGVGLGLSIAHELAKLLGGRIDVESTPGAGSMFRLLLPAGGPAAGTVPPTAKGQPAAEPASDSAVVLLIGDDDRCRLYSRAHRA
jgi:signal transduction histidine kinase